MRKVKQLLTNFEAEKWENLSNLRLAKKSVAYKKTVVYPKIKLNFRLAKIQHVIVIQRE